MSDIKNVIHNLNKPSAKRRSRAFWKRVEIDLITSESEAPRTRRASADEGHVGDERSWQALDA
jgi:hypothetical protein